MRAYLVMALCAVSTCAWAQEAPRKPLINADSAMGIPVPKTSLAVRSEPPGATIKGKYGINGDYKPLECVAPCTLKIPKMREIQLTAYLDGYVQTSGTSVQWKDKGLAGSMLEPGEMVFTLAPVSK